MIESNWTYISLGLVGIAYCVFIWRFGKGILA